MRKRKKLNEWCHAATCLRVSLAGKDVLQRFFDITQEDYFTQMEKENPQKVEQIKEQMTSLGCYSESLTIGETIWELFENCCIEDPRYYRAADCAADQNLRIYSTEKDWAVKDWLPNKILLEFMECMLPDTADWCEDRIHPQAIKKVRQWQEEEESKHAFLYWEE